jgi:hypothetical protein
VKITDSDRIEWLVKNMKTKYVSKNHTGESLLDDYRQVYVLPDMLAVTCINSFIDFREAIDIKIEAEINTVEPK